MKPKSVVPGIPVLKAMAKAGLIKLHRDTGARVRHWSGQTTTAFYVDDVCPGVQQPFRFKGRDYKLKYFDGCWSPFVVDIDFAAEIGIDLNASLMV